MHDWTLHDFIASNEVIEFCERWYKNVNLQILKPYINEKCGQEVKISIRHYMKTPRNRMEYLLWYLDIWFIQQWEWFNGSSRLKRSTATAWQLYRVIIIIYWNGLSRLAILRWTFISKLIRPLYIRVNLDRIWIWRKKEIIARHKSCNKINIRSIRIAFPTTWFFILDCTADRIRFRSIFKGLAINCAQTIPCIEILSIQVAPNSLLNPIKRSSVFVLQSK